MLKILKLPKLPFKPDVNELYSAMFSDKKVSKGKIRFILPKSPGLSIIKEDINKDDVMETLRTVFE